MGEENTSSETKHGDRDSEKESKVGKAAYLLDRTGKRRFFTMAYNKFIEALEEANDLKIQQTYAILKAKYERLCQSEDHVVEMEIAAGVTKTEAQFNTDLEVREEYLDTFETAKVLYEDHMDRNAAKDEAKEASSCESSRTSSDVKSIKHPKLALKPFDGQIKNWTSFWSRFLAIHEDTTLPDNIKFEYLIESTVAGTPPRALIDLYPPTKDNYKKAVEHLKNVYGRPDLIVDYYTRELIQLVTKQIQSNSVSLNEMYNQLEAHLKALETLKIPRATCAYFLFPWIETLLPKDVLKVWFRYKSSHQKGQGEKQQPEDDFVKQAANNLNLILDFLKEEVEGELNYDLTHQFDPTFNFNPSQKKTTSSLVNTTSLVCIFCDKTNHESPNCLKAQSMTVSEREAIVKKRRCCLGCLKVGHTIHNCKTHIKCLVCGKKHYVILCPNIQKSPSASTSKSQKSKKDNSDKIEVVPMQQTMTRTTFAHFVTTSSNVQRLASHVISATGGKRLINIFFDTCAQLSYIQVHFASNDLKLKPQGEIYLNHSLFGGVNTKTVKHLIYHVTLQDIEGTFSLTHPLLSTDTICDDAQQPLNSQVLQELAERNIPIPPKDIPVSILLGADIIGRLYTGKILQLKSGPTCMHTSLGWTIMGPNVNTNVFNTTLTNVACCRAVLPETSFWDLELLGIKDPIEVIQNADHQARILQEFNETIRVDEESRLEVRLPWKEGHPMLQSNRAMAFKRLLGTSKRLTKLGHMQAYDEIFQQWLDQGIIEIVNECEPDQVFYLPHSPVFRLNHATTKIRPVFDASATDVNGVALNKCLESGPNLIELIFTMIMQFRLKPIGIIADIAKAFMQISIQRSDRDVLRFLWWNKDQKTPIVYRHKRVVQGLTASPFLLAASLRYIFANVPSEYVETANKLKSSFYVDNLVASLDEKEVKTFKNQACAILRERQLELRAWVQSYDKSANSDEVTLLQPTITPTLGILWNFSEDSLSCHIRLPTRDLEVSEVTRRLVLSELHKIFDPLGLLAPNVLLPKIWLQQVLHFSYDQTLPVDVANKFLHWINGLSHLSLCRIPRYLMASVYSDGYSIHVFSDASDQAYAAVIFIRFETNDGVQVQFLAAKSRVAPSIKPSKRTPHRNKPNIHRLELMGTLIAVRLAQDVLKNFPVDSIINYWTDSTTALAWIKRHEPWGTFVGNRVAEIRKYSNISDWRYVPGEYNPADLPSRGCDAPVLLESKWWEGPEWLKQPPQSWPNFNPQENEQDILAEKKKSVVYVSVDLSNTSDILFSVLFKRYSNYKKVLRITAMLKRAIVNFRNRQSRITGPLTAPELVAAEIQVLQWAQLELHNDNNIKQSFQLHTDEKGLLRVQTRILRRNDNSYFREPILLPPKHIVTRYIVEDMHQSSHHAGTDMLISLIRQRFWVPQSRRTVRSIIRKCIRCLRFKAKALEAPYAPLPLDRVKDADVFEVTGVDLAGPIHLRTTDDSEPKGWIVLFTCAIYRAIHLELITSISTEAFIPAITRFINRRGRPDTIYSDKGTNFVGTVNHLDSIDWDTVVAFATNKQITWKFNPPTAAWWGGWWERIIRTLKDLLKRSLSHAYLSYQEMETVLTGCEAVINARPLTYISDDPENLVPLTPSIFLQNITEISTTDLDTLTDRFFSNRAKYVLETRVKLKQRFRDEYLALLKQKHQKQGSKFNVGDIVLIGSDNKKRQDWPIGKIIEIIPGKDTFGRVAKVKTQTGDLLRPIQRLYPLEITAQVENCDEPPAVEQDTSSDLRQKSGKKVSKPKILNPDTLDKSVPEIKQSRSGRVIKAKQIMDLYVNSKV